MTRQQSMKEEVSIDTDRNLSSYSVSEVYICTDYELGFLRAKKYMDIAILSNRVTWLDPNGNSSTRTDETIQWYSA